MADLIESLKNAGDTIKTGLLAVKNASAPSSPSGPVAGPLGKDASGNPVRYNRDGSPPMPVTTIDSKVRKIK